MSGRSSCHYDALCLIIRLSPRRYRSLSAISRFASLRAVRWRANRGQPLCSRTFERSGSFTACLVGRYAFVALPLLFLLFASCSFACPRQIATLLLRRLLSFRACLISASVRAIVHYAHSGDSRDRAWANLRCQLNSLADSPVLHFCRLPSDLVADRFGSDIFAPQLDRLVDCNLVKLKAAFFENTWSKSTRWLQICNSI
jgi:hypothetical protein